MQKHKKMPKLTSASASPSTRPRHGNRLAAYVGMSAVAFVTLAFFAHTIPYFGVDLMFTRALQAFNPAWFDSLMRGVSQLGFDWKALTAIGLINLLLIIIGLRWEAVMGLCGSTGIWALDNMVKGLVARPRPAQGLVQVITHLDGPSFTSGHVTSFTVFYGFMWYLSYSLLKPSWKRTLLLSVLATLIALVGLSRVYSGEHWLSDVVGSYLLGSVWLAVIISVYYLGRRLLGKRKSLVAERANS
jgi:membrane-associated phospholipid phosphatase